MPNELLGYPTRKNGNITYCKSHNAVSSKRHVYYNKNRRLLGKNDPLNLHERRNIIDFRAEHKIAKPFLFAATPRQPIAGGATAAVVSEVVEKAIALFQSKGGDVDKANATIEGDKLKITDGTTCVTCDAAGTCTECSDQPQS